MSLDEDVVMRKNVGNDCIEDNTGPYRVLDADCDPRSERD